MLVAFCYELPASGCQKATSRHDYLPFGEELSAGQGARTTTLGYSAADGVRQKFTQQERDSETGLDYMHARYSSSAQGRFTSADTVAGSIGNPQSLNRYAYVGNNPVNYSDPTGHDRFSASSNGFAETMGQGSNKSPENPDYDMGLPQRDMDQINAWHAQDQARHDQQEARRQAASAIAGAGSPWFRWLKRQANLPPPDPTPQVDFGHQRQRLRPTCSRSIS